MRRLNCEKALDAHQQSGGENFNARYDVLKERLLSIEYTQTSAGFPGGNDHGPAHIKRVLENLDKILGPNPTQYLSVYELWLTMMAIIYHDVGLLQQRENHPEIGADMLLEEQNSYLFDRNDKIRIKTAIFTHGSKADISAQCRIFPKRHEVKNHELRMELVCALVRLADELDEDERRADSELARKKRIADEAKYPGSEFFWRFNQRIQGIEIPPPGMTTREITINMHFEREDLSVFYDIEGTTITFVARCLEKIIKINKERVVCCRYFPDVLKFTALRLVLLPLDSQSEWKTPETIVLSDDAELAELLAKLPRQLLVSPESTDVPAKSSEAPSSPTSMPSGPRVHEPTPAQSVVPKSPASTESNVSAGAPSKSSEQPEQVFIRKIPNLDSSAPGSIDFHTYLSGLKSQKFKELFPNQSYVLDEYAGHYFSNPDVAVELPTGAGKTLIALLIAAAWREKGKKVAILSANKTLARQMRAEAELLGIPVAYMEGRKEDIPAASKRGYQRAGKVGIMNYWVYFNQNPVVDPADLLIMDDAHLAEQCLQSLYSLEVSRYHHKDMFNELAQELLARFPEYDILADAIADNSPPTTNVEVLSFIDQVSAADRIREVIDARVKPQTDTSFRWSRIRPHLRSVNLYMSRNAFWFRPYVYPLIANDQYSSVKQAVYMSATVGDAGDLARRLGVRQITKIPIPAEFAEVTSGRRLVIMNRANDKEDIPKRMAKALFHALRVHPKSVWLCTSDSDADKIKSTVEAWLHACGFTDHLTWRLTSLGDEIDEFKAAPKGHLFVAGRFDGMDFKGDECRIVVIKTLPRAINLQEDFITSHLRDAGFMRRRLNQRIVQALGRCNRASDDFGVYFLADQRFVTHFSLEMNTEGLPPNIVAEIDLAQDLADKGEDTQVEAVKQFIRGDFSLYDQEIAELRSGVPARNADKALSDTSQDEVLGWAAMHSDNFPVAAEKFGSCRRVTDAAGQPEISALHGWHQAKALFLQGRIGDVATRERSLQVLEDAVGRGGRSSWFNRMRHSLLRARSQPAAALQLGAAEYGEALVRGFDSLLEWLGTTGDGFKDYLQDASRALSATDNGEFLGGLETLGEALGFAVSRLPSGCVWRGAFGAAREVYTFAVDVDGQATAKDFTRVGVVADGQRLQAESDYAATGYKVRSFIVTDIEEWSPGVRLGASNVRAITKRSLLKLWEVVGKVISDYRSAWSPEDSTARAFAAAAVLTRLPKTGWLGWVHDNDGSLVIPADALVREWAKE